MTFSMMISAVTRTFLTPAALVLLLGATGCDRTSMGSSHGRAYREAFARQALDPLAGEKPRNPRAYHGLDSQEASIVAKTYRMGLTPRESGDGQQAPMVLMAPRGGGRDTGYMPPPSVPER